MDFNQLIANIEGIHAELAGRAVQQVNTAMTVRNWLIGFYLVEFEQNGDDRATKGEQLMKRTAQKLRHIKGMTIANLFNFRHFYITYRWFADYVLADKLLPAFLQTLSVKMDDANIEDVKLRLPAQQLLNSLTFSHFIELGRVDSELKRRFYEVEAVKNAWTVKELTRATTTLLFERTGLSTDKAGVIAKINERQTILPAEVIRNPYMLEFLGLDEKPQYSENDLETAILNHLQTFLTELGRGFCFEARQRRITFDNTHYRIDLVFYNRILKSHVLIDLKLGRFDHADAGQMNVYLNYYKKYEMTEGDNPPVGIILCADKNDSLVEFATGGLANEVFVSKYLVQLPDKDVLRALIEAEVENHTQN
ncbi:PDDEXK nuclease domain-containing protein [Spirosoma endbachense]|uniref:DUF1016 family protein n=1 Tax=Spirosoma endbachense TaxID=2666025 RepID=A0A6P1VT71_9BACT|nr:PDDEXK nuclease domain-containing protein [Spirosoma endbachense]QHV95618.1 DUF1016 family protein [Spirosoma endbachense]